jgi:hypothetical protein
MDFSSAGLKAGLLKAGKVLIYIAVSGAITALINYITPLTSGEFGTIYAVINLILVFLQKWLGTHEPIK